jgi:hypothetical protein
MIAFADCASECGLEKRLHQCKDEVLTHASVQNALPSLGESVQLVDVYYLRMWQTGVILQSAEIRPL